MTHGESLVTETFDAFSPRVPDGVDPEVYDHPQDECGVFGVYAPGEPVIATTIAALYELQHRGHSGAGLAYVMEGVETVAGVPKPVVIHKGHGRVRDALRELHRPNDPTWPFDLGKFEELVGSPVAIGHTRYSTAESEEFDALHPHALAYGALAHNGEIHNMHEVARQNGVAAGAGESDSSVLCQVLDAETTNTGNLLSALHRVLPQLDGAYCLTIIDNNRLLAARDPWGYHPLALGELPDDKGYVVASESIVFDRLGAEFVRDVEPGEIIVVDGNGVASSKISRTEEPQFCSFEGIYTSRKGGVINGIDVTEWRKNLGRFLAMDSPVEAEMVVGVPATGLEAAAGYAEVAGLPLVMAIEKREDAPRTFQLRGGARASAIDRKYIFHPELIVGRDMVVADDSTIKGHTHRAVVARLRELGARSVHLRLSSYRYQYSCYMGMDTHDPHNLIASHMTDEEIADYVGADSVRFNEPERVQQAADRASISGRAGKLCMSCYFGAYPFPVESMARPGVLQMDRRNGLAQAALGNSFSA